MTAGMDHGSRQPGKLDETQRGNLASELYAIHARIFHGVQYESFAREVIPPPPASPASPSTATAIVGYCAVHFHDSEVFQYSKACVTRAGVGDPPEYRGATRHSLYPPGAAHSCSTPASACCSSTR